MIGARTRCPWGENLCATSSTFAGSRHMIGKVVTGCVAILPYHTATQDRGSECRDFGFISRIVTALMSMGPFCFHKTPLMPAHEIRISAMHQSKKFKIICSWVWSICYWVNVHDCESGACDLHQNDTAFLWPKPQHPTGNKNTEPEPFWQALWFLYDLSSVIFRINYFKTHYSIIRWNKRPWEWTRGLLWFKKVRILELGFWTVVVIGRS